MQVSLKVVIWAAKLICFNNRYAMNVAIAKGDFSFFRIDLIIIGHENL
jgi:hypothetical protein